MFTHANNVVQSILELPPDAAYGTSPHAEHVRVACLEAFLMNVRAITEFFAGGKNRKLAYAKDLVPGWVPEPDEIFARLKTRWLGLVSAHVAHLAWQRAEDNDIEFDDSEAGLRKIADDVYAVWTSFRTAWMSHVGPVWVPDYQ